MEAPEAESFGFPHSLLIANDIDPTILHELPEDVRLVVLEPLQEQLAQHRAAERQRQQPAAANQAHPPAPNLVQQQPQPAANANANIVVIEEDFLNALPEDVRQDVLNNQA